MNSKNLIVSIFFVLSCFTSLVTFAAGWEYLVKTYPLMGNDQALSNQMNELGKSNWELVNCTEGDAQLTCVFKRPAE